MAKFNCFSVLVGKKKKSKVERESPDLVHYGKGLGTLQVMLEHPVNSSECDKLNSTSFSVSAPFGINENSTCKVKVLGDEKALGSEAPEAAYEGEDEHDENLSMKRDFSDFDLHAHNSEKEKLYQSINRKTPSFDSNDNKTDFHSERDIDSSAELIQRGHVSDPGFSNEEFWASPGLQRSCSNLETREVLRKMANRMSPLKSFSFRHLQNYIYRNREEVEAGIQSSPESVMTHRSADRVMLKKRSSSQILPSRSRRLWWKLFLWSHRNMVKPQSTKPQPLSTILTSNQKGGYSSDTLEPNQAEFGKRESPGSLTGVSKNNSPKWNKFQSGATGLWPQNQWVAFPTESSSMTRVDEWVNSLETQPPLPINDEDTADEDIAFPPSPIASARSTSHMKHWSNHNVSEEVLHANAVIQSLNSSSTVAHVAGMGLIVIPAISRFSSLRSVNLSGNFIVHITPGSLPKGLHTLNLSRNKIVAIEGLRDLTRLRVLDLSYNRISRIGQGLSNCTLIKELYLAGNKISDVEGLHRLLKLMVLDLSFNKITTAKALGQLVAHYSSLLALNLLGNPIQSNIGEEQLRKTVSGILPQLTYLNKQPIKPQRARDVATSSVAKAALGGNEWTSRRKALKRISPGGSSSSSVHRNSIAGTGRKNSHRSKRTHHHSPTRRRSALELAKSNNSRIEPSRQARCATVLHEPATVLYFSIILFLCVLIIFEYKRLSKCTFIKELNLVGNKISNLEGLHRLSKLIVFYLSFNKITTARPVDQLVANYNSVPALNLLGNPIDSNIHEEQLQKVVFELLLHLAYFNE
ncbi:hypothetical protein NE237_019085 [Protea cynaroides]|uniref:Uncharacterized protein n=1 Tax=Protea cynaroides TaxID=273540 RepID=A0A9Q0KBB3_9MAGN|nr:hypothetical protein NE237_019085 [Protea cynaroides]